MSAARGPRPSAAAVGRRARGLFRGAPAAVRAHVAVRWATAPLAEVVAELPAGGRVVEIGCGHGLVSACAALADPGRTVLGVDIDAEKIRHAREAARGVPNLEFDVAVSGAVPAGPWDAVAFVDVLYLLPESEQRRLLTEAVEQLAPGGLVVVKEMGTEPAWKVRWNTAQETLAVKVLRITAGSEFDFVPPATVAGWLRGLGLAVATRRLDRGRPHPHVLVLGRAAGSPGTSGGPGGAP
ncbi:class I SAM-dependent methyltransferase [Actinotalea solisilvae]|uniref:class I SAM-dependent methyltransferase n=1 Tax=Actinotalea solisilvae TaxID=2072922 RepID=UPI0018F2505C|nr:class I SAM-dependent methyltransferase [Actinotalea solisilvae]